MTSDRAFMREAVRLGRRGLGRTSPNPPVGAVVVARGQVVGRGFHRQAGAPHGEAEALREAGSRARGATLYVTLEPCNHHGRTPPCADTVIASGVRRVVIGVRDPNPHVRGGGLGRLRRAGITVDVGIEADRCAELIRAFTKHVRTGLPFVRLKLAASADGRIATATGASRWITGDAARRYVHQLRNENDAVMVGAGTIIADDPALTCRLRNGRDPLRVIVDGRLRVPLTAAVLRQTAAPGTLIATAIRDPRKLARFRARGATILAYPGRQYRLSLRRILAALGRRGVSSVLIEGGATLAAAALRERVVDQLLCFYAPLLIGGDGRPMIASLEVHRLTQALRLDRPRIVRLGQDVLMTSELRSADA